MIGRAVGLHRIPLDKIDQIVALTGQNHSKRAISEAVGVSISSVFRYQKAFNLI